MLIEVTQEDIDKGEEAMPDLCPVALAFQRHLPEEKFIKVFSRSVRLGTTEYQLPEVATLFIEKFDDEECGGIESECLPFSFTFEKIPVPPWTFNEEC